MSHATAPRLRVLVTTVMLVAGLTVFSARQATGQDLLQSSPNGSDQDAEFETDRAAFTPATTVTGESIGILEVSYAFIDNRDAPDTNSAPELLGRYGITKWLELRLGWNYEVGGGGNIVSANEGAEGLEGGEVASESRLLYGFKAQVSEQDGWIPRSVFILESFTPTFGDNPSTQAVGTYALGWELPMRSKLDAALRYATANEEGDGFNRWAPSAVLRVPLTDDWQVHAEYFGVYTAGREIDKSRAFFSPGTQIMFDPDLEVGLRVGWGLTDAAARFFVDVGMGWRF